MAATGLPQPPEGVPRGLSLLASLMPVLHALPAITYMMEVQALETLASAVATASATTGLLAPITLWARAV